MRPLRACFLIHSHFEEDARARRQAQTLLAAGWEVDAFALRRPGDPSVAVCAGVHLHRLGVEHHQGGSAIAYAAEYAGFAWRALLAVAASHRGRRYRLVQVSNVPDTLVASAMPLRLLGVPILLDLREAMPEFFAERFARLGGPAAVTLLGWQERVAIAFSHRVITVNEALKDRLVQRGIRPDKVDVIVNSHDANLFRPGVRPPRRFMEDGTLRLVYAGALTPLYEVEVAVEAVQRLRVRAPGLRVRFEVVGRGDREAHVRQRVAELGVGESVRVWGRVPLEDVPDAMAAADVGLALTRSTAYTQLSLSTKVFEYAAMERPIVASRLPMVRHYFGDSVLEYESGDPEALAAALLELIARPREREQRVELAAERASALRWEVQGARYLTIVQALAG